ncbi:hypothetical protein GCM10023108_22990 [Saccharopolyspora hordei]
MILLTTTPSSPLRSPVALHGWKAWRTHPTDACCLHDGEGVRSRRPAVAAGPAASRATTAAQRSSSTEVRRRGSAGVSPHRRVAQARVT